MYQLKKIKLDFFCYRIENKNTQACLGGPGVDLFLIERDRLDGYIARKGWRRSSTCWR